MPDHHTFLREVIIRQGARLWLLCTCALLLLMLLAGLRTSQAARTVPAAGYSLEWHAIFAGGDSSGGAYRIAGSIGQASAGQFSGGHYQVSGGFWVQAPTIQSFLPIVSR